MTRLFRSKSCGLVGLAEQFSNSSPRHSLYYEGHERESEMHGHAQGHQREGDEEEYEEENSSNFISTPLISPGGGGGQHQFGIVDLLVAALRKSLVTCSVSREDVSALDISYPTEIRHVSHVTFDRFDGFLGLPSELQPEVPRKVPSASASVFGVSPSSMQCSLDDRGNSVPTILLKMQKRLYAEGGLKAEGIFRINAENSHEEYVHDQLNRGHVPLEIDVHCLAGLIKAWLRELPTGVLDSLTPEQVMHCNTEEDCTQHVKLIPPTEAALLDWAVNLMADVVQHEECNKMNARNIAMVFAPNMTLMADPLTALIHALQVMNFLKTLILKTIRERQELIAEDNLTSSSRAPDRKNDPFLSNSKYAASCRQKVEVSGAENPANNLLEIEFTALDKMWDSQNSSNETEKTESISSVVVHAASRNEAPYNESEDSYESGDWLNLRKGVRRLCRHPVFQLSKPAKKTKNLDNVDIMEEEV